MCVADFWCFSLMTYVRLVSLLFWRGVPQYLHIRVNLTFFCHGLDLILCAFVCMCQSGGRTITVTGQGFDLVQSATMQVEGIGRTVSNLLCSFHRTCGKLALNRAKMQAKLLSLA